MAETNRQPPQVAVTASHWKEPSLARTSSTGFRTQSPGSLLSMPVPPQRTTSGIETELDFRPRWPPCEATSCREAEVAGQGPQHTFRGQQVQLGALRSEGKLPGPCGYGDFSLSYSLPKDLICKCA